METPPLVVPLVISKGPEYVTTLMGTDILSQPMNGITKNTHAIQHVTGIPPCVYISTLRVWKSIVATGL